MHDSAPKAMNSQNTQESHQKFESVKVRTLSTSSVDVQSLEYFQTFEVHAKISSAHVLPSSISPVVDAHAEICWTTCIYADAHCFIFDAPEKPCDFAKLFPA